MATIIKDLTDNEEHIMLGSGFAYDQAIKPHFVFGDWSADVSQGHLPMICVCNAQGKVGWIESRDIQVVSVDGQSVDAFL